MQHTQMYSILLSSTHMCVFQIVFQIKIGGIDFVAGVMGPARLCRAETPPCLLAQRVATAPPSYGCVSDKQLGASVLRLGRIFI